MTRNRNENVLVTMVLKASTAKAYLVFEVDGEEHWLPRSQVSVEPTGRQHEGMDVVEVSIPEWLAVKRGLA